MPNEKQLVDLLAFFTFIVQICCHSDPILSNLDELDIAAKFPNKKLGLEVIPISPQFFLCDDAPCIVAVRIMCKD